MSTSCTCVGFPRSRTPLPGRLVKPQGYSGAYRCWLPTITGIFTNEGAVIVAGAQANDRIMGVSLEQCKEACQAGVQDCKDSCGTTRSPSSPCNIISYRESDNNCVVYAGGSVGASQTWGFTAYRLVCLLELCMAIWNLQQYVTLTSSWSGLRQLLQHQLRRQLQHQHQHQLWLQML